MDSPRPKKIFKCQEDRVNSSYEEVFNLSPIRSKITKEVIELKNFEIFRAFAVLKHRESNIRDGHTPIDFSKPCFSMAKLCEEKEYHH